MLVFNAGKIRKGIFINEEGKLYTLVYDKICEKYKCYLIDMSNQQLLVMYRFIPCLQDIEEEIGSFDVVNPNNLSFYVNS
jgi:hypothetical protein